MSERASGGSDDKWPEEIRIVTLHWRTERRRSESVRTWRSSDRKTQPSILPPTLHQAGESRNLGENTSSVRIDKNAF